MWSRVVSPSSQKFLERAGPATLVAALLASSTSWILADQHVWPWDQAWYGEVTLDLWQARTLGVVQWITAMIHAFGSKPPALAWIGQFFVPLNGITGSIESSLLLVNVLAAAGTFAILYFLARRLGATRIASLAGVLACAGAQTFVGLTHQYMVEPIQCFTVSVMMAIAWRIERRSFVRAIALTVLVAALSFLIKASSGTYVLPLLLYIVIAMSVSPRRARPVPGLVDLPLSIVSLTILIGTASWYAVNWHSMVEHWISSSTGDDALNYGAAVIFSVKLKYWLASLATGLSPFAAIAVGIFGLIALGLSIALARLVRHPVAKWIVTSVEDGTLFSLALAGTIVATIVSYSLQINEESRFLMPLFPMIAVLVAWSLSIVRNKYLSFLFFIGLLGNAFIVHASAQGKASLPGLRSPWLIGPQRSAVDKLILTSAVNATCQKEIANAYNIVAVEYPEFNANSAAFYSTKRQYSAGYRCYYTSLGYAEADMQRALDRINLIAPKFILTIEPSKQTQPNFVNAISLPMAELLAKDPRFALVSSIGDRVLIYRKVQ
jgi:dolichyl-phosphate-mannose-protein mannosyltransferase